MGIVSIEDHPPLCEEQARRVLGGLVAAQALLQLSDERGRERGLVGGEREIEPAQGQGHEVRVVRVELVLAKDPHRRQAVLGRLAQVRARGADGDADPLGRVGSRAEIVGSAASIAAARCVVRQGPLVGELPLGRGRVGALLVGRDALERAEDAIVKPSVKRSSGIGFHRRERGAAHIPRSGADALGEVALVVSAPSSEGIEQRRIERAAGLALPELPQLARGRPPRVAALVGEAPFDEETPSQESTDDAVSRVPDEPLDAHEELDGDRGTEGRRGGEDGALQGIEPLEPRLHLAGDGGRRRPFAEERPAFVSSLGDGDPDPSGEPSGLFVHRHAQVGRRLAGPEAHGREA